MKQSSLFPKTSKTPLKDATSINHKLLVQAGFIDQLMAGSWTLLPLGIRVIHKIEDIVREEINAIGSQEMLMPLLHPKEIWNQTGRWDKAGDIMYKLEGIKGKDYTLSFTHEEIVMDLLKKRITSYQDLPVHIYHFSTKFRNELRAKSGILRGREFMMKDLYSAHTSKEDLMDFYDKTKEAYSKIFTRLGIDFRITEADGGVFTDNYTHEFQALSNAGEDTIFYCDNCNWGANIEIFKGEEGDNCPNCKEGLIKKSQSIEIGNIFPLDTWYSEKMGAYFTDKSGDKKPIWFGSYGIGITRLLGTLAEISHDEKGLIWPEVVAPFKFHLLELPGAINAESLYNKLRSSGAEILWDDRSANAGQKFADADLIGIPWRLVISEKTGEKIEIKSRTSSDTKLLTIKELLGTL